MVSYLLCYNKMGIFQKVVAYMLWIHNNTSKQSVVKV